MAQLERASGQPGVRILEMAAGPPGDLPHGPAARDAPTLSRLGRHRME